MYFDQATINDLNIERRAVPGRCQVLLERYMFREYRHDRTHEFVRHGLGRRLKTLTRCVESVFEILPPDFDGLPDKDELSDAAINIQAFVFNVFGAIDNLAWIYVYESELTRTNGAPLHRADVGLRANNQIVRGSLSAEFRTYLEGIEHWFANLEEFRPALAHRLPLAIPPYVVPDERMPAWRQLEEQINVALRERDLDRHDRLSEEQRAHGSFAPLITHSFEENAIPVRFHPQLIADFGAVEEIAERMLQELEG